MKKTLHLTLLSGLLFWNQSNYTTFYFINNKAKEGHLDGEFIKKLVSEFKPDFFLETGTLRGITALTAAPFFKEVHTVELSEAIYKSTCPSLAQIHNIKTYLDNSPAMIKAVAPTLDGHILFWLDAHYSGGDTAHGSEDIHDPLFDTPIRQELRAIKEANVHNCTILIDDIRGFGSTIDGTQYLGWWAYPTVQEVCKLGKEINTNFSFALLGDMLLMYDHTKFNPEFSPVVHACTASRLYDGSNLTDQELLDHEKIIMNAQGNEKTCITNLYHWAIQLNHPLFCHDLWYGLTAMGSGTWRTAIAALTGVVKRTELVNNKYEQTNRVLKYNHWRINHYLSQIKAKLAAPKKH